MPTPTLKPLSPRDFDYWKAQHLLNRAGFGGTPGQVRALANMGLDDAVDYILDYDDHGDDVEYTPVRADDFDHDIMHPQSEADRRRSREARRTGDEAVIEEFRKERQRRQRADRKQMADLQRWWLQRMIESPRPLEEKMTLFWHGHFATGYRAIEDSYHMFLQNQLFRANAVGNFRELAHGIIHDPAMLRYLNNNQNRKQKPNENLARELMELFTLGEGHGYTETDIKEGARALTGYTYVDDEYRFRSRLHDAGEKRILGRSGRFDGDDFVDIILENDFVSRFICLKLYKFFVADVTGEPNADVIGFVTRLAKRFKQNRYDVKPVLKTIFKSQHFYDDAVVAGQIKSPVQLVVQTIRSLRTPVRSLTALVSAANLMGQHVFYPPSVKGWDGGRSWVNTSTMFIRQNTVVFLLTGRLPGTYAWETDGADYDATHLVADLATTGEDDGASIPRDAATYLLRFMLGAQPHPERIDTIVAFIERCDGRLDNDVLIGVLSLIAAMPEYQLC